MKNNEVIAIARDAISLAVDPGRGVVTAARQDGAIRFGPLSAWARVVRASGKMHNVSSSLAAGWQVEEAEIETPAGTGPGVRAVLDHGESLPLTFTWEVVLVGGEDAAARLTVENHDEQTVRVFELAPLAYRGADPGLDMGAGYPAWRFYRTGYQSWTPAGSIGVMESDFKPRFFFPSRSGTNPLTPYSRAPGQKVADWMAQVVEPKLGLAALLGFITSARLSGRVEMEVKYDRHRRLEAISDGEGAALGPGRSLSSEWLLLSLSTDPLAQQARYFDLWGQAMKARKSPPKTGWCSWYFSFWNVSEDIINRNLLQLESRAKAGIELVQIDDGFEPVLGEWLDWNDKFPTAPAEITRRIRAAGFDPGLWLAPFLISRSAPLYKKHPQWVVRNERGRPVINFLHPTWKGRVMYALDLTRPAVQNWLRETFTAIVTQHGFKYLKLDFLYAASTPGVRHDPALTGAEALRRGLTIIREAAGDDAYILGCGCPLGPAIGLVDAMRVSQDIDIHWKIPGMDAVSGVASGPGAVNCLSNNLARMQMHGRLWANDPDCVVLREARGGMKAAELQSELTLYYLTGGALFLSEDLARLSAERRGWFNRMLPPSNEAGAPLDLFAKDFPETVVLRHEDSALVALFNWSDKPRELTLDLKGLGLEGSWRAFDFWAELPLGAVTGKKSLGLVPAHGCKYLRLVRADGRARLLATTVHMGMGEHFCRSDEDAGKVKVRFDLPGARSGRAWAVASGGRTAVRDLRFEDQWEGTIE